MKSKQIVVVATLDTKGQEVGFVRDLIQSRGHAVVTVDCGLIGEPAIVPSISRHEVASAAGTTLEELLSLRDKNAAIQTMAQGAANIVSMLYERGELDGVLGLGGVQGTIIATTAMKALPVGVPKFMLSAVANGQATFGPFVGVRDVAIMHSVADILGLNVITRQVLAEAAGAIVGMCEMSLGAQIAERPTVAMTMAGVTTACAMATRQKLEAYGYEVIGFHCNGIGAQAMEELAAANKLQGVIDLSPHDIGGFLRNGLMQSSATRMEATVKADIPLIFVPGATDFILRGAVDTIEPELLNRKHVIHNPIHTHIRANYDEMRALGLWVGDRLANATGRVYVIIPRRGFSQLNSAGGALYDPEADSGFLDGLTIALEHQQSQNITVSEIDLHINDAAFGDYLADLMHEALANRIQR